MSKSIFFTGQPIIAQIISLIPERIIKGVVKEQKSDLYYKKCKTYEHLVAMLFTVMSKAHHCVKLLLECLPVNGS